MLALAGAVLLAAGHRAAPPCGPAALRRPSARAPSWRPRCGPATSCSSRASSGRGRRRSCAARCARSASGAGDEPDVRRRRRLRGRATAPLAHLDLYRLGGMGDEDPGLLDPYFAPDAIAFVEWPERAPGAWPEERVAHRVPLEHAGGDERDDRVILGLDTATAATAVAVWAPGGRALEAPRRPRSRASGRARAPAARARRGGARRRRRELGRRRADRRRRRPGRLHRPAHRHRHRARAGAGARRCRSSACRASRRSRAARRREAGERAVLAVLDARRGEAFAAAWRGRRAAARAGRDRPGRSRRGSARAACGPLAAGDGAVRFREQLERAGATVPDGPLSRPPRQRARGLPAGRARGTSRTGTRSSGLPPRARRHAPTAAVTAPPTAASRSAASPTPTCRRSSRSSAARSRRRGRWRCSCSSCPSRAASAWPPRRRRAGRLPRLLALRHRLAHHERLRRPRPPPPRDRHRAAARAVRARRRPRGAVHARGAPLQRRRIRALRAARLQAAGVRRRYYQDNGEDALIMWRTPATRRGSLDDVPNAAARV